MTDLNEIADQMQKILVTTKSLIGEMDKMNGLLLQLCDQEITKANFELNRLQKERIGIA